MDGKFSSFGNSLTPCEVGGSGCPSVCIISIKFGIGSGTGCIGWAEMGTNAYK